MRLRRPVPTVYTLRLTHFLPQDKGRAVGPKPSDVAALSAVGGTNRLFTTHDDPPKPLCGLVAVPVSVSKGGKGVKEEAGGYCQVYVRGRLLRRESSTRG